MKHVFQTINYLNLTLICKLIFKLLPLCILTGCSSAVILHPKGYVGSNEKFLLIIASSLMLIVVIPSIVLTLLFTWRYRATNKIAKYTPEWQSSIKLEVLIWLVPSIIIFILSILVWIYSHKLDPYKPLVSNKKPLIIQVVSFDWKWFFIYPDQNIASVNEVVFPTDVPIHFFLTSASVMNSFFIPQLGTQIMTMPGMQTQLYLIANTEGNYAGISSNFSGYGFTGMKFQAIALSAEKFQDWIKHIKKTAPVMDINSYLTFSKKSLNNKVEYFSSLPLDLFIHIMNNDVLNN